MPLSVVVLAVALPTPFAHGLEVVMSAEAGTEYTSNTLLTETDEIGEWIFTPGVSLQATENTATLEMDVGYDYLRRMYTKDYWEDDNRLVGRGTITWYALADRLDFFASNVRTESTERARQAETQDNRQIVTTTEAGSRLRFQPRPADELQLEYVFRDVRTTRTKTDSQRNNVTARYITGLSENRSFTVLGTYSDIEYEGFFPDAEYTIATAGYNQTAGPIELELTFGWNWYERTDRGKTDNPTYSGSLVWQATPTVSFSLEGTQLITDQGSGLSSGNDAVENTDVNAAFEETRAAVGYYHLLGANTLSLTGYWTEQQYADDVPLTNEVVGGRLTFSRSLRRNVSFEAFADFSNRTYEEERDDQDELRAGFRVDHTLGRALSFNWGISYEKRDATTSRSYEEWVGTLQLYWTFLGAAR
ncbi:MAG: hypothetical protein AB7I04_17035 [Pseudomonadales bacterium]